MEDDPSKYEHILPLPNNRQLHYAAAGNPLSTTVILFFSGYFSIGNASDSTIPAPFGATGVHYIAPTIPGNGASSSTPRGTPYHVNLCQTITCLLENLHPSDHSKNNAIQELYVGGGSYGSVQAQMLYGAPFNVFPLGEKLSGMLLAAPFSPFRYHKEYTKCMTWPNWVSVGPPSQWIPFRLVPRLLSTFIALQCKNTKGMRHLLDKALFSKMGAEETERFEAFAKDKRGQTAEEFKQSMAEVALRCTTNWDGFLEGPDVLHSAWGFEPASLDEHHSNERRSILVMQGDADDLGEGMSQWLVENYRHAKLKKISGGHLAALYYMDESWTELTQMSSVID